MKHWNSIRAIQWPLAIVPAGLFAFSALLNHLHGPYYFRNNFDPDYNYLLNSLSLLNGHAPSHTDHPGTTLQVLGAVVVFFQWLCGSLFDHRQPLNDSVLSHPEPYLLGINLVLNVFLSGALYWSASVVHRLSKSLGAAMLLQITVLVYMQTFLAVMRVSPEPLLIAAVLALMVPVAPMVLRREGPEPNGNRLAVAAGAIFGFGLITKITFAPLAAVILLFPKASQKRRFAATAVIASVLFLLPVAVRLPAMASWFTSLLTHSGHYGGGPVGIPAASVLFENFVSLWQDEPALFLFLGLYVALLFFFPRLEPEGAPDAGLGARPLLLTACIAIVGEIAMVVKHPSTHYLMPALILTAFVNACLYLFLPTRRSCAVMLTFLGIGFLHTGASVWEWIDAAGTDRRNIAQVRALEDTLPGCEIIGTYRSSLMLYALSFASDYSGGVHHAALEKLYPGAVHYDPYSHRFLSFAFEEETEQLKRSVMAGKCILLEGTPLSADVLKQFIADDGIQFQALLTTQNPLSLPDATTLYRLQPAGNP